MKQTDQQSVRQSTQQAMQKSMQESDKVHAALSLSNISKTYANGFTALKEVSLNVAQGDFFALLGPNGAGKSTLINIISSLIKPTSGSVSIFGVDLEKHPSKAKKLLGVVPQEFNFNQFEKVQDILITQAGYFGIPKSEARKRSERFLKQLGLWDKKEVASRNLSGGMKRRLMIARAMMHEPKLLILDEPTAGVDIELRRSMWDFVQKINRELGTTIILTTHYLEEAEQLCRDIAILDQGQIIKHTSMKNLLSTLSVETFVLDLDPEFTPITDTDVGNFPALKNGEIKLVDAHTIEITIDKSTSINHIFEQLSIQGIRVMSMRNKANRLEELFIKLVDTPKDLKENA